MGSILGCAVCDLIERRNSRVHLLSEQPAIGTLYAKLPPTPPSGGVKTYTWFKVYIYIYIHFFICMCVWSVWCV